MHVLVTGAAGFIGAALSERLAQGGHKVTGLDNLNDYYPVSLKNDRLKRLYSKGGGHFEFRKVDFADHAELNASLANTDFEAIVHLGAQAGVRYSLENPHAYVQSNLVGHFNILELARTRSIPNTVYASSSSVYGTNTPAPFSEEERADRPVSLYAATKRADELLSESYAHLYRLPLTGLRFFTVYGPFGRPDMMPWIFADKILRGIPIPVFNNGEMERDFTYIDDIVDGIVACLAKPPVDNGAAKPGGSVSPHAVYNIGNSRPEKLLDVIEIMEAACDRKAVLEMLPMQKGDVTQTYADVSAMKRDFGYAPKISVREGMRRYIDWFRNYHSL
ncbi:NAD-dependent epimerase/dehydratase family protein [Parerythrobacter jejuensis]|uniref:NAD-dependent epimerase/dehydratase family protein n=1 Tax=Parerythrobacter jejuensis TaxID=795812 RepID=A0A845AY27_9SPHN|nr:NAD-dependent epimerase/dehydratase family protein [Parerythrobacter jejuensis]MXP30901.1 NAD-dependent epimerase/dehydratase family protein [Parerythrobacter jejuensis]MXP33661.1 NAD-dependent epimerase/dehydratase family protein [Parerythrobacter jejuensis]